MAHLSHGGEGGVKAVMDIVVDQAPPSRHHRIIKYVSVSMCTGHVERILTDCLCRRRLCSEVGWILGWSGT